MPESRRFALLDDDEHAMDWLEAAATERDPDVIDVLREPEFGRMRAMPRFVVLARRIQSPVSSASNSSTSSKLTAPRSTPQRWDRQV